MELLGADNNSNISKSVQPISRAHVYLKKNAFLNGYNSLVLKLNIPTFRQINHFVVFPQLWAYSPNVITLFYGDLHNAVIGLYFSVPCKKKSFVSHVIGIDYGVRFFLRARAAWW